MLREKLRRNKSREKIRRKKLRENLRRRKLREKLKREKRGRYSLSIFVFVLYPK